MRALIPSLLVLCCFACKPGDSPTGDSGTVDSPGKGPIEDGLYFDPDHLLDVDIEMAPADFEQIRDEMRDFFEELSGDCTAEPFGSPFTWFEGEITIDGETLGQVGVRKKGFLGSMSWEKPSLKVETDQWVDGQLLANGTERVTLNNNVQDPSVINQCLGFGVFAAAGIPAPRCNYALVTVNGETLGVYTHIEDPKKDFLRRHFGDDDGDLYEGTLSDFADNWRGTFDPKTKDTDPTGPVIAEITAALDLPDGQMLDELATIIDLDSFYRFWATETLLAHWDGYASNQNNFFVYRDPDTDLVTFMPWGADQLFSDPYTPNVFLTGRLSQRLFETQKGRNGYVDAMQLVLDTAWDEPALHAEIDRLEAFLVDHVTSPDEMAIGIDNIRYFVDTRRDAIAIELEELRAASIPMEFRDPFCMNDLGVVSSDFATVYGSLEDDPFLYTGTLSGDVIPPYLNVGATAGAGEYGEYLATTLAVTQDWSTLYQTVVILPAGTGVGTWPVGFEFGTAYVFRVDLTNPYDEGEVLGLILGEVTLTEAGQNPGEPVSGTVSGTLLGGLF